MIKILFICHGNICRSTMCEFVLKDMVAKAGIDSYFEIDSAATSRDELGNDTDPRTIHKLDEEGVPYAKRRARQVVAEDYDYYDMLICADDANVRNTARICGGDPERKIVKLMEFAGSDRSIADPWYTHDFDATYDDVAEGCEALLVRLIEETKPTHLEIFREHEELCGFFSFKEAAVNGSPFNNPQFFEKLDIADTVKVWPKQVHGTDIAVIGAEDINVGSSDGENQSDKVKHIVIPDTDGAVTNVTGVLLTTVHADCLPVYFYDREHRAIGLVHAGWRGTCGGIAPQCVKLMAEEYGADPSEIQVFIGPGIGKCCFEVGYEVYDEFKEKWSFADDFSLKKDDKFFIDLKEINKRELIEAGVKPENIGVSDHCTFHEPELFCSYRREGGTYMRMGAGLVIKDNH